MCNSPELKAVYSCHYMYTELDTSMNSTWPQKQSRINLYYRTCSLGHQLLTHQQPYANNNRAAGSAEVAIHSAYEQLIPFVLHHSTTH